MIMTPVEGEEYLILYPALRRWINECAICHSLGYKPDMPEEIYTFGPVAAKNLRHYFKPLALNKGGICEACSKLAGKNNV